MFQAIQESRHRFGLARTLRAELLRKLEHYLFIQIWAISIRPAYTEYAVPALLTEQFEFRVIEIEELLRAATESQVGINEEFVTAARARGDVCFGALDKGKLVAYLWRSVTTAPLFASLWICIEQAHTFYGYKMWVSHEYRGRRLFETLRNLLDLEYSEKGVKTGISYVALHNLPSMASMNREANLENAGYVVIFSPAFLLLTFRSRRAKKWISFSVAPG